MATKKIKTFGNPLYRQERKYDPQLMLLIGPENKLTGDSDYSDKIAIEVRNDNGEVVTSFNGSNSFADVIKSLSYIQNHYELNNYQLAELFGYEGAINKEFARQFPLFLHGLLAELPKVYKTAKALKAGGL